MSAAIFSGNFIKLLKNQLKLGEDAYILTGSADPSSVATDAPRSSVYLRDTGTVGKIYIKQDDGLSTNWNEIQLTAPKYEVLVLTIGEPDNSSLIIPNTSGTFHRAIWNGRITGWKIFTVDETTATCELDIKINGTTIGQNVDLSAAASNSASSLSIAFSAGDRLSFNVDANTSAKKIVVEIVIEET